MTELEQLVQEKEALQAALKRTTDAIESKQILNEGLMKAFGFTKHTTGSRLIIYHKTFNGAPYEVILDVTLPHIVTIHRGKQAKSYGFEIETPHDFRELLILCNIL